MKRISTSKSLWWTSLLALAVLVLAACQPAAAPVMPTAAPTNTSAPVPTATVAPTTASSGSGSEPVISVVNDPKLGQILVDGKGMTLYAFTKDTADTSNCSAGCAKAWPPLLSQGSPKAGTGVDQSMLGTAKLSDGTMIVTYNHMPLYYFAKDQKPGDVLGQDVAKVWFVVSPDGKMVTTGVVPATGGNSTPAATGTPSSSMSSSMGQAMLNVATDPKLGKFLVDGKGMTLYIFTKDTADTSNCTGGCAKAWPPFLATGDVKAGDGVDQSMIGTATLADGSKIVTYNHMPLYYWKGDVKAGDATGQGVQNVWYVLSPDGKPVMTSGQ